MDIDKILKLEIEGEIKELLSKFKYVPDSIVPKINVSNDSAQPFIDIGFGGDLYYVIRERGVELERRLFPNVDYLLREVFIGISHELASNEELKISRENKLKYSPQKVNDIEKEYLKRFNPDWDL